MPTLVDTVSRRPLGTRLAITTAIICLLTVSGWSQITAHQGAVSQVDTSVSVVLTDHGFHTLHLYLKKGTIAMLIQNRSRLPNVTIQIKRKNGTEPPATSVHSPSQRDNQWFFDIQPGEYTISVAQVPAWTSALTISAN
jgi:hypothetical protein